MRGRKWGIKTAAKGDQSERLARQSQPLAESISPWNSELRELLKKVLWSGDKEAERKFLSHGLSTLPYLFEAFCSDDETMRIRVIAVLAKIMPWEVIDRLRNRFKNGTLKLTAEEKKIIQKYLDRYLDADSP